MDPPLAKIGELPTCGKLSIQQFEKLQIGHLLPTGFLFVWMEKELIPYVLQACEAWGFHYVENFCWVRFTVNNKVAREPSTYFNKSHRTLLMLRKVMNKLKWRAFLKKSKH